MSQSDVNKTGYRGTDEGGKLKATGLTHWIDPNEGATNSSGFSALPGGYHRDGFANMGYLACIWTSSEYSGDYAYSRWLNYGSAKMSRSWGGRKDYAYSVRCNSDSRHFSYLTVWDTNFTSVSSLIFYGDSSTYELVLINAGAGQSVNISSIHTNNPVFNLDKSSFILSPGDSLHLTITFSTPDKDIYLDTLYITSDDPHGSLISIPLNGTFPPEISITDSSNISCYGFSDGTASATGTLGSPPYGIWWDEPYTWSPSITGLDANVYYRVNILDDHGWRASDSIILSQPDPLNINPYYSDTICLNSNDGYIGTSPSGGTPPIDYIWSNGSTNQSLTDLEAGNYNIKVTDSHGCEDSISISIKSATPFEEEKICVVTIDQLTGYNTIVWEKTRDKGIRSYNIYREDELIGTTHFDDLSIFKDTIADPEIRPYLYYISVVDSCENESGKSSYHKPLFLQYVNSDDGINLRWSYYVIEGDILTFDNYSIYRGSDSLSLSPFAENIPTAVDVYTDKDSEALTRKFFYRVAGILTNPCFPTGNEKAGTGPYWHSLSNMDDNKKLLTFMGTLEAALEIRAYPNPFTDVTRIEFSNPNQTEHQLRVYNLSGKLVREIGGIMNGEVFLRRENLDPGYYVFELKGEKFYRGKFVIR